MPGRVALLCALGLVWGGNALAQDVRITDCDIHAAAELDPQRKSAGIPFYKLDAALAIPACEAAVREFPNNERLLFQLGRAYLKASNFTAAAAEFRKAAEHNHALAQFNLGFLYQNGRGVTRDDKLAVEWLRKAADQGVAPAQLNLGMMYKDGRGVARDDKLAFEWLRKAADQNNARAQYNLAVMYANGIGVPRDYEQGVVLFRKAADQGLAAAQVSLGVMYARGQGVAKNEEEAMLWYREAAQQGDTRAKAMLDELESSQKGKTR